jgi:3-hydroxybutyrate dehydrogenase
MPARPTAVMAKTTLDQWNAMLAVNLTGVFLTFREGLRRFAGWGRLIAVASTAGLKGYAKVAPYAAAKHGVVGLVPVAGAGGGAQAHHGERDLPGLSGHPDDRAVGAGDRREDRASPGRGPRRAGTMNPQNRLFQPAEVTAAALYLCGPGRRASTARPSPLRGGEL